MQLLKQNNKKVQIQEAIITSTHTCYTILTYNTDAYEGCNWLRRERLFNILANLAKRQDNVELSIMGLIASFWKNYVSHKKETILSG